MSDENSVLVYSTEQPKPGKKKKPNNKPLQNNSPVGEQKLTVRLDRKGRRGKSVTVIDGLLLQQKKKEALLKQLKVQLGTGGVVKGNSIEIQGDHCSALMAALKKMGHSPKRSGG